MADTKISDLPSDTAPASGDLFPFVDVSVPRSEHITFSDLMKAANISVADAGGVISGTTLEAATQELAQGQALVNTVGTSGSTETLTLAPVHKVTMDQNCTFTFPTPTIASHTFMLHLIGAYTPTFPASVDWPDAAAPTYTTPSLYVFTTTDTGTNWLGQRVGKAFG